jgi:hypothetical protein
MWIYPLLSVWFPSSVNIPFMYEEPMAVFSLIPSSCVSSRTHVPDSFLDVDGIPFVISPQLHS